MADDLYDDDDQQEPPALDSVALLTALAEQGGELGKLAAEALVARQERESKAVIRALESELAEDLTPQALYELVTEFETAASSGDEGADVLRQRLDVVKDVLRAQVLDAQRSADVRAINELRALYAKTEAPETVERRIVDYKAQQEALRSFEATSDALASHPVWQAYESMVWERNRGQQGAEAFLVERRNSPSYWQNEVSEAAAANDAVIDALVEV